MERVVSAAQRRMFIAVPEGRGFLLFVQLLFEHRCSLRMEKLPAGENEARADKACMFGMQGPDPDEKGTGTDPN